MASLRGSDEKRPFNRIIEEVAVLLAKKYGWDALRYLIYCTDAERYCKWASIYNRFDDGC